MNANRMINMAVRIVMRKLMNKGINAGVDLAARRGQGNDDPADPQKRAAAQQTAKRARQAMRVTRRMGRF
ncbi:hypothetical protein Ga0609869_002736 [Rhodovulum iodosum]|uniref:Uncharacterized protein n=1 Tax=Rhodovulum iodosum TaxID=68291 RepID=A0ABV3XWG5_9RHOB|nr:hypothetical protein [Rhodovulum robiginosum]RSK33448.1 hypothetical protein EJA01_09105 [Rhodovulum robiginosum]